MTKVTSKCKLESCKNFVTLMIQLTRGGEVDTQVERLDFDLWDPFNIKATKCKNKCINNGIETIYYQTVNEGFS